MPKVSVIIPAYNAEKYIAETLDSVLKQTYQDFELIVIDDESRDNTLNILGEYQKKYQGKIKIIKKQNGGPASARNEGIKAATGEYIAFNDADDLWLPEKLDKQIAHFDMQLSEVGMVYTHAKKFDLNGVWTLPEKHSNRYHEGNIFIPLLKKNFIPNQSVIVRRNCFDKVGLFDESPDLISIEDYDMWLRIAKKYKVSYLDAMLSLYREHSGGISKKYEKSFNANIDLIKKHSEIAKKDDDTEIQEIMNKVLSQRLYTFGYFYLKDGKKKAARQMFKESLRMHFVLKTLLMIYVSFIPLVVLDISNTIIKTILRPPKIIKSQ